MVKIQCPIGAVMSLPLPLFQKHGKYLLIILQKQIHQRAFIDISGNNADLTSAMILLIHAIAISRNPLIGNLILPQ